MVMLPAPQQHLLVQQQQQQQQQVQCEHSFRIGGNGGLCLSSCRANGFGQMEKHLAKWVGSQAGA